MQVYDEDLLKDDWLRINASGDIASVHEQIKNEIDSFLESPSESDLRYFEFGDNPQIRAKLEVLKTMDSIED